MTIEVPAPSAPRSNGGSQRNLILLALLVVLLLFWAGSGPRMNGYWIAVMLFGGGVGWVEILGRYRYAPLRATLSFSAAAYVGVNVLAAAAAYYLIPMYYTPPLGTSPEKAAVETVLMAGFGALVFLRSSLFKVRVGDSDVGIGPAAVLDTLLLVADRGVDRREAVARAQDVSALVTKVKDPRVVAKMLTRYCLALMQNVDEKTKKTINDAISDIITDREIPDSILMDLVALQLGVVVGPDVLEAAVLALGDRLAVTPQPLYSKSPPPGAAGAASAATPDPIIVSKTNLEAELKAAENAADPTVENPTAPKPPERNPA